MIDRPDGLGDAPEPEPVDDTLLVRRASVAPRADRAAAAGLPTQPIEIIDGTVVVRRRAQTVPGPLDDDTAIAARALHADSTLLARRPAADPDALAPDVPDRILPARTAHVPDDADVAPRTVHERPEPVLAARSQRPSPASLPSGDQAALARSRVSRERRRLVAVIVIAAALVVAGAAGLLALAL